LVIFSKDINESVQTVAVLNVFPDNYFLVWNAHIVGLTTREEIFTSWAGNGIHLRIHRDYYAYLKNKFNVDWLMKLFGEIMQSMSYVSQYQTKEVQRSWLYLHWDHGWNYSWVPRSRNESRILSSHRLHQMDIILHFYTVRTWTQLMDMAHMTNSWIISICS